MYIPGDLVWQSASNTPAGGGSPAAFQLGSPRTGWRTAADVVGDENFSIFHAFECDGSGNRVSGGAWETFVGKVDTTPSPDEIIRSYLWESSTGAWIDWSGTGENTSPDIIGIVPGYSLRGAGYSPMLADGSRYFLPVYANVAISGAFTPTGQTTFACFDVDTPALLKAVMIRVGTGVGGANVRCGVYTCRSGKPHKLLASGLISAATSSSTPELDLTSGGSSPGQLLLPGRYFLAFQFSSSSVNVDSVAGSASGSTTLPALAMLGIDGSTFNTSINGLRCATVGYSSGLEDPWTTALVSNANNAALPISKFKLEYV